ncbi:MAG: ccsA 2, partial [Spartobacteria bacterium]|nr:ccsA 2 [Spartobacteria bacterium]
MKRCIFSLLGLVACLSPVRGQQPAFPAANSTDLNYEQFGLLAIQDGGRRKPIDTFARETLIRITGRSIYQDKNGRTWRPLDFVLSALLETHDWRNEPMVLVSLGKLKAQLGLPTTQRRFTFTQLTALPELNRLADEAHVLRRAEKPLDRLQNEVMSVSERLALLSHVMDGSGLLVLPAPKTETEPWVIPPEF